jgi:transcriptional regulator with XRE-family HTH domain
MEDTEDNIDPGADETPPPPETPRVSAGGMIRQAREAAGIPAARISGDLRISEATLEAIESGRYEKLAGSPYVRALLMSLSRHLRLDPRDVLKAYDEETGDGRKAPAVQVSPYKDDSGAHAKAHKQIFILLLAVLLFILLLIMGKVNTSSPDQEPESSPGAADTLLNIDPLPDEEDILPDDSAAPGDAGAGAADQPVEPPHETRVRVLGLSDSVWLRILPAGGREVSEYLRRNRPTEYVHDDAITFITRQGASVRVFLGDTSVVPQRRRFVVDGAEIIF